MTLQATLAEMQARFAQCDSLIANAHRTDTAGQYMFPEMDRKQITVAAFLNGFIAWESFLEDALSKVLTGQPTISGTLPTRYASPPSIDAAKAMVIGINKYFDYANFDNISRIAPVESPSLS